MNHNSKRTKAQIENRIRLNSRGIKSSLQLTNRSGRIIYRYFTNALTDPKEAAIILGCDVWGDEWVVHNNSETGIAVIEPLVYFTKGDNWFNDARPLFYDRYIIADMAITCWKERRMFDWLSSNQFRFDRRLLLSGAPDISSAIKAGGLMTLVGSIADRSEQVSIVFNAAKSLAKEAGQYRN